MQQQPNNLASTPSWQVPPDLAQCVLLEAIALDPRPTYIVDLDKVDKVAKPVFWNPALESLPELFNAVITGLNQKVLTQTHWVSFTIKNHWKVVAANYPLTDLTPATSIATPKFSFSRHTSDLSSVDLLPPYKQPIKHVPSVAKVSKSTVSSNKHTEKCDLFQSKLPSSRIRGNTPFSQFFRNFDWASTELGEIEQWPQQLVELCNLMLSSPDPIGVYWGKRPVILYNEAVISSIGERHPNAMGQLIENVFPEIWEGGFRPLYEDVIHKRQPWVQYNDRRVGYSDGRLEEVFWNVTLIPIIDDHAEVLGTWGTLYDVTTQNFWQRRIATLLRLTASMNASDSFDAMWTALAGGFEAGDRDVPHLLVYTALHHSTAGSSSEVPLRYRLKTHVGYNSDNAPYQEFDINDRNHPLAVLFQKTLAEDTPMRFDKDEVNLGTDFWNAFQTTDPADECRNILIIPIRPTHSKDALAYLVIGSNPYVRYDQEYREFIDLARRQVSSTMASILLREEEVRRERLVAEEASAQLELWKAESKMHELRFTRLAETAPIGICTYSVDGSLTYANDVYRIIFGMSLDDDVSGSSWWVHLVHPEDLDNAKAMFGRLLMQRQAVTFEIRVKLAQLYNERYSATPSPEGYIWVLVSAYAEPTGDGPQTVIACFTDINETKRAEEFQNRRLEDMINAKRQQEAFIDMTSHEIRNPLSVVLHCSEEIISTSMAVRDKPQHETFSTTNSNLDNILDAAETIVFCTLHQKRIVDDILTLSKLESNLLPITPDHVKPLDLVESIMKLFDREIRKSDMRMEINIHPTFHQYQLDQVQLDPNRISQIIINLISNAIKFTKTQNKRRLDIVLGGSVGDNYPTDDWPVTYMSRQQTVKAGDFSAYWNPTELAHLHFAVIDTGAGMSDEEQQNIFSRFTQATPRTHVKYGGSGLGLYICRALSETHGGQIGCKSVPGRGSAFGFHVEVGRSVEQLPKRSSLSPSKTRPFSSLFGSGKTNNVQDTSTMTSSVPAPTTAEKYEGDYMKSPAFHVLIVEDNVLNQKVLRRQLEKAGHTVVVAHHGQDALEVLQKTTSWVGNNDGQPSFDFILMDVEMPIMNGLTCTKHIRNYERQGQMTGHVPIIATTGNARDEQAGLALSAGMDQVVLKPYSLSVLLAIAQKLRQQYGTDSN